MEIGDVEIQWAQQRWRCNGKAAKGPKDYTKAHPALLGHSSSSYRYDDIQQAEEWMMKENHISSLAARTPTSLCAALF